RHTSFSRDWSSDVCSSDLDPERLTNRALTVPDRELMEAVTPVCRDEYAAFRDAVAPVCSDVHVLANPEIREPVTLRNLALTVPRSEERRVGKEGRARWTR